MKNHFFSFTALIIQMRYGNFSSTRLSFAFHNSHTDSEKIMKTSPSGTSEVRRDNSKEKAVVASRAKPVSDIRANATLESIADWFQIILTSSELLKLSINSGSHRGELVSQAESLIEQTRGFYHYLENSTILNNSMMN
jgi:hypothetical protein